MNTQHLNAFSLLSRGRHNLTNSNFPRLVVYNVYKESNHRPTPMKQVFQPMLNLPLNIDISLYPRGFFNPLSRLHL